MQRIPWGFLLLISPSARSVISKPIHQDIPKRPESVNQQRLTERNPDVINHKKTALEIGYIKIRGLNNGFGVLRKAIEKTMPRSRLKIHPPFSAA